MRFFIQKHLATIQKHRLLVVMLWYIALTMIPCLYAVPSKVPLDLPRLRKAAFAPGLTAMQKGKAYAELAAAYRLENEDSALVYAELAVAEFRGLPPSLEKAKSHHILSKVMYSASRFDEAKQWIQSAETICGKIRNDSLMGSIYFMSGNILTMQNKLEEAISYHLEAIRINEKVKQTDLAGRSYLNIGRVHSMMDNNSKAKEYYISGIKRLKEGDDSLSLAIGIQNLGSMLNAEGNPVAATEKYEEAVSILLKIGNQDFLVPPLVNLGGYYLNNGKLDSARSRFLLAYDAAMKGNREESKLVALKGISGLMLAEGNIEEARQYIQRAWEKAEMFSEAYMQGLVLKDWITIEEKDGNYEKALELERKKSAIKSEMADLKLKKTSQELMVKFETEKKEAENELLRAKAAQQENQQRSVYLVAGLVAFFLFSLIILLSWSNRRKKFFNQNLADKNTIIRQKNETLENRNELLQNSVEDRNALMRVVAHDLKAPLTKILAMMYVLQDVREDPEKFTQVRAMIANVVQGGQNLIEELVLMSELENSEMELELQEAQISPLLESARLGFQAQAEAKGIQLSLDNKNDAVVGMIDRMYFARVIDNILSNAIKFSPRKTTVHITLEEQSEQNFSIQIADQGPGIPAAELPRLFDKFSRLSPRPTAGESSTGLGLSIAKELVHKMNGKIKVHSVEGEGTTMELIFPHA